MRPRDLRILFLRLDIFLILIMHHHIQISNKLLIAFRLVLFQHFLNKLRTEVMNRISCTLVALLLTLSLVAFISHLIRWIFLIVYDLIVGVDVSATVGWVVLLGVLLLFGLSLLFLVVLLGICLWVYI